MVSRLRCCRARSARTSGSVGVAFFTAVPRAVVALAVVVVLAVGLVVLLVVGDQVAQGEAVVGGDEVDRRVRCPAVASYRSLDPDESGRELTEGRGSPRQKSRTVSR